MHTPLTFSGSGIACLGRYVGSSFYRRFIFILRSNNNRRFYNAIVAMLATYAIGLIVREVVRPLIGGRFWKVTEPIPGLFEIGDQSFSIWRGAIIILTIIIMTGCYLFLAKTNYGLKIRGAMENPALARASGISTTKLYSFTFAFGAALAGLAGALMVPLICYSQIWD